MTKPRKISIAILLLLALAIAAALARPRHKPKNLNPAPSGQAQGGREQAAAAARDLPKTQLPEGFPQGLPLEAGAQVTRNLAAVNPAGQKVLVREFVSQKPASLNFSLYQAFLRQDNWQILDALSLPGQQILTADKAGSRLRIRIFAEGSQQARVAINFLEGGGAK